MKKLPIILYFLLPIVAYGQQLIANGDFEVNNICTEYNSACAPEAWFRIPPADLSIMFYSGHKAKSGKYSEVIVIENIYRPIGLRIFLYTKLLCPLVQGQEYLLTFYIKPLNIDEYQIGILFNDRELISRTDNPIGVPISLLVSNKDEIEKNDSTGWRKFEQSYTAIGGEQFLTFGNFSDRPSKQYTQADRANVKGDIVCLIDSVSIIPKDTTSYPLCENYTINKELLFNTNERHTYNKGINKLDPKPEAPSETVIDTSQTIKEVKFEVPYIAFDFDKHVIKPSYILTLDSLVETIAQLDPYQISIIGHTDSRGSEDYNFILSERRALAIKVFILKKLPNYPKYIYTEGRGELQPRASNAYPEGRAKNRRVEIVLLIREDLK